MTQGSHSPGSKGVSSQSCPPLTLTALAQDCLSLSSPNSRYSLSLLTFPVSRKLRRGCLKSQWRAPTGCWDWYEGFRGFSFLDITRPARDMSCVLPTWAAKGDDAFRKQAALGLQRAELRPDHFGVDLQGFLELTP